MNVMDMKKLELTKKKIARGMLGMFMLLMIMMIGLVLGRFGMDPAYNNVPGIAAIILTCIFLIIIMMVIEKVVLIFAGKEIFAPECPCEFCKIPELMPKKEGVGLEGSG